MSANGPRSGQPAQAAARPAAGELLACQACHAGNRPQRGYCRECGAALAPVCRGCRFVNERGDRFCGGCGSLLVELPAAGDAILRSAAPAMAATGAPGAGSGSGSGSGAKPARGHDAGALLRGDAELAALLAPLAVAPPKDELPQANITQEDLDRLFGGTS